MISYFKKRECRKVRGLLSRYLNGTLPQADAERVGCHLLRCEECQDEFRSLKETVELLHRLPSEIVSPPFFISEAGRRTSAPASRMRKLSISASIILVLSLGTWAMLSNFAGKEKTSLPQSEEPKLEMVTEGSHPEDKEVLPTKTSVAPLASKEDARLVSVKEVVAEEETSLDQLQPEQASFASPYYQEIKLGNFILGFGYEGGPPLEGKEGVSLGRITSLIAHLQEICPCSPLHMPPGQTSKILNERR
jgi:hypothetical protein